MIMTDTRSVFVVQNRVRETMGSGWHAAAALIHIYTNMKRIYTHMKRIYTNMKRICTNMKRRYTNLKRRYTNMKRIHVYQGSSSMPCTTHSLKHMSNVTYN